MQNRYWIRRGQFSNEYSLCYTVSPEQEAEAVRQGWERTTRKEAERLCRMERDRSRFDSAFSGYADDRIWPFGIDRAVVHGSKYWMEPGYVIYWPFKKPRI